ncbi:hypothetical protein F5B17DRAFT_413627 [Nemania serpens]|nr:hypothetical protein F5B17DRAFT_413627 [Nemania serpens]
MYGCWFILHFTILSHILPSVVSLPQHVEERSHHQRELSPSSYQWCPLEVGLKSGLSPTSLLVLQGAKHMRGSGNFNGQGCVQTRDATV